MAGVPPVQVQKGHSGIIIGPHQLLFRYSAVTVLHLHLRAPSPNQGCHMSWKCQGKTTFSPGQVKVREF